MSNLKFKIASDGVDPSLVPQRLLPDGARMPAIGLGTFGSDKVSAEAIAEAVKGAASIGYRHFDCAAVYGNESHIGHSLKEITQVIDRDELWITSKLWNDSHGKVLGACEKSLRDLQLDYLDLYLVHWPFPNHHDPGVGVDSRDPHARPYIHEKFMETWYEMERLVEKGLVRYIGTSNMTIPKMEPLLKDAAIKPVCNQMELHPHFQQQAFFDYCLENGIIPVGFAPIGSPDRPARDRTAQDTSPIEDPVIVQIAEKHGVHPAVICVKWAVQRGQAAIPFSTNPNNYLANLKCTIEDPLIDEEMEQIAAIDKNCRLIKGQVFLWEGTHSWRDLWDESE